MSRISDWFTSQQGTEGAGFGQGELAEAIEAELGQEAGWTPGQQPQWRGAFGTQGYGGIGQGGHPILQALAQEISGRIGAQAEGGEQRPLRQLLQENAPAVRQMIIRQFIRNQIRQSLGMLPVHPLAGAIRQAIRQELQESTQEHGFNMPLQGHPLARLLMLSRLADGGRFGQGMRGPRGFHRSDARLEEEINEALARQNFVDPEDIQVSVKDGEVTLQGTVEHRIGKLLAELALENIFGVKDVHNQLRVRQPSAEQRQGEAAKQRQPAKV